MSLKEQVASILNTAFKQELNGEELTTIDTQRWVDVGSKIVNSSNFDFIQKKLNDAITLNQLDVISYEGIAPELQKNSEQMGGILRRFKFKHPIARDNENFKIVEGQSNDPFVYYGVEFEQYLFSKTATFEVKYSYTKNQFKDAFKSERDIINFISGLQMVAQNAITIYMDSLKRETLNNLIAQSFNNAYPDPSGTTPIYGEPAKLTAVNLLYKYNTLFGKTLTVKNCLYDADFERFVSSEIENIKEQLRIASTLHNVNGEETFTPSNLRRTYCLSQWNSIINNYVRPTTHHNETLKLNDVTLIPYWQGSGGDYNFNNVSDIHVNIQDTPFTNPQSTKEIIVSGVLGIITDDRAAGVYINNISKDTAYNPADSTSHNWTKAEAMYFNDLSQNAVVLFIADKVAG